MKDLMHWSSFDEALADMPVSLRKFYTSPSIDLYEEDDALIAKATAPGIEPENIDIVITDDVLAISGVREEEEETDEKDYYHKEIRRGSFSRSIQLPKLVDAKHASADYTDGILTITMPTVEGEQAEGVKVPVNQSVL